MVELHVMPTSPKKGLGSQLKHLVGQTLFGSHIDPQSENMLVVSPYDEEPHLLDLTTLDVSNQLLAKGLVGLKHIRDDFRTAPYVDSFNVSSQFKHQQGISRKYPLHFEILS